MRVTEQSKYTNLLSRVQQNQTRLQDAIDQISSGKRVDRSSDDPSAVAQLDRIAQTNSRHESWLTIGRSQEAGFMATDTALDSAGESLVQARELAMSMGSGVHSQEQMNSAADEVAGLRDSLLRAANAKHDGRYVFSGVAEKTAAFDDSGTFRGSATTRSVQVGYSTNVTQVNGGDVFGGAGGGTDAFAALNDLEAALRAGDKAAARDLTESLKLAHTQVNGARQMVGNQLDIIEGARSFSENVVLQNDIRANDLESVDIAKASTQLAMANTALQALAQTASVNKDLSTLLKF